MSSIFDLFSNIAGFDFTKTKQDYREDAREDWRTDWRQPSGGGGLPPAYVSGASVLHFDFDLSTTVTANDDLVCHTPGTWTNAPTSFSYQWLVNGANIAFEINDTYTIPVDTVTVPVGAEIGLRITASNGRGSGTVTLGPWTRAAQPGGSPTLTAPTYVFGARVVHDDFDFNNVITDGDQLTVQNPGFWGAYPLPTFTYQWFSNGVVIVGETTESLYLDSMVGTNITVRITATNSQGSSNHTVGPFPVVVVPPSPPVYGGFALFSINNVDGSFLGFQPTITTGDIVQVTDPGTWYGFPAPTFTYQWLRNGATIAGATGASYTVTGADVGQPLSVRLTGTNSEGVGTGVRAVGTVVATPAAIPQYVSGATLEVLGGGPAVQFATLSAFSGTWQGLDQTNTTYTYEWFVNGVSQGAANEGAFTFPIESAVGTVITVKITGQNPAGSSFITLPGITVVAA